MSHCGGVRASLIFLAGLLLALAPIEALSDKKSKQFQTTYRLAVHFHQAGNLDQALTYYAKALKIEECVPIIHLNVGGILFQRSETEEAEASYLRALRCQPDYPEAHLNLAILYSDPPLLSLEKAEEHARKAIVGRPGYAKAHQMLGNLLQNTNRTEEANRQHKIAHQLMEVNATRDAPIVAALPRINPERIGEKLKVELTYPGGAREVEATVLAVRPTLIRIPGFLTRKETERIKELSRPKLSSSCTVEVGSKSAAEQEGSGEGEGTPESSYPDYRKSETAWLNPKSDPELSGIEGRLSELTGLSPSLIQGSEHMQVVYYQPGGHYKEHYDSTPVLRRFCTVLYYLNEPEEGGHTVFPLAETLSGEVQEGASVVGPTGSQEGEGEEGQCGSGGAGASVEPKTGDAILFYNYLPDGSPDEAALHTACPIIKGEKWVANHWLNHPEAKADHQPPPAPDTE